jgi:oxidase EvaA
LKPQEPISSLFLKSAFTEEGSFISTQEVIKWIVKQNENTTVKITKIPFSDLKFWEFDESNLRHSSGQFFSIDGIRIKTNWGSIHEWEQPIIFQNEVGYLGFITKEFNGVLHFLVQAKIEPGNINHVQLSPTLQATRSNYNQVHKGKKPLYLDYFLRAVPTQILLDQLQSEQGARFLKKRNRNIIIKIEEDIPVYENFIWITLAQIKKLMQYNNIVNMDTRTVVSGILLEAKGKTSTDYLNSSSHKRDEGSVISLFLKSSLSHRREMHTIEEIITFLTQLKSTYDLDVTKIPLKSIKNWIFSESEIFHIDKKYFKVIAADVEIGNREVVAWSQPMIQPEGEGLCAFICKEINGLLHFAVQAKLECGNQDIIEFAPTVQCLTGNYKYPDWYLPFLDYVINAKKDQIIFDSMLSEEGGRFFREQNRNLIVFAKDEIPVELPPNFIWMTLNQLFTFIKFNNYLNIQARSLISSISFV